MFNFSRYLHDIDLNELVEALSVAVNERSEWVRPLYVAIMLLVFAVGVTGNLLICFVIYRDRSMHTANNYYLFNLAMSDLVAAFSILTELTSYINFNNEPSDNYYNWATVFCKVHYFIVLALWNNGILTLTALSIERYVAICHPLLLSTKPIWRRVMPIITIIWMLAILESLPEVWTIEMARMHNLDICIVVPSSFTKLLNGILGLTTFIIPLSIMVFVYAMIAFKVNVIQRSEVRQNGPNRRNNRSKVNRLIVLTLSFLVCWVPYFVVRIILCTQDVPRGTPLYNKNWDIILMVTSFNSWFSIVVNPLLCNVMSSKFRKSLKCSFKQLNLSSVKTALNLSTQIKINMVWKKRSCRKYVTKNTV